MDLLTLIASIHLNTEVYHFELFGFTNPKDYNSILPKWWSNMFQRFTYHEQSQSQGNFVFHRNFKNPIPDLLFGSVRTENLEYKKVFVTDADLMITSNNLFTKHSDKNTSTKQVMQKQCATYCKRMPFNLQNPSTRS